MAKVNKVQLEKKIGISLLDTSMEVTVLFGFA